MVAAGGSTQISQPHTSSHCISPVAKRFELCFERGLKKAKTLILIAPTEEQHYRKACGHLERLRIVRTKTTDLTVIARLKHVDGRLTIDMASASVTGEEQGQVRRLREVARDISCEGASDVLVSIGANVEVLIEAARQNLISAVGPVHTGLVS